MAHSDELLEAIRVRAYFLWEKAGRPGSESTAFWDEARQQVEREREQESSLNSEG